MKVKVNKSFISGLYTGNPGDLLDLPDPLAKKLEKYGTVEQEKPAPASKKKPVKKGGRNGSEKG